MYLEQLGPQDPSRTLIFTTLRNWQECRHILIIEDKSIAAARIARSSCPVLTNKGRPIWKTLLQSTFLMLLLLLLFEQQQMWHWIRSNGKRHAIAQLPENAWEKIILLSER